MATIDVTEHEALIHYRLRRLPIAKWAQRCLLCSYEDLVQEGQIGLLKAAAKFDPDMGMKFITYARWWVDAQIIETCMDKARTVRVPRKAALDRWKAGVNIPVHATSLDTGFRTADDGNDMPVLDLLGYADYQDDEKRDKDRRTARVAWALRSLPERHRKVLRARFFEDKKLRDIAPDLGVSHERVRQIENEAKAMLRVKLARRL